MLPRPCPKTLETAGMLRRALFVFLSCALLTACDKFPSAVQRKAGAGAEPQSTVAVLDLAAVAKALGRDEVFKEQVLAAGKQLQDQLAQFTSGLQDKLREEQAKLGEKPTEAEQQQLQKMVVEAQRQVQQSQVLARQKALEFQNQLATQFRSEVQPVAGEVARAKGATSVLLTNTVMWFEPAVDITGAVIDAMRARGATSGAPALAPAASPGAETPPK
jgi:Skp family chaperone for outer membrane proteins